MATEVAVIEQGGSGTPPLAVVPRTPGAGLLRPIAAPAEVLQAQEEARALIQQALQPGRDYGVIPGTGDKPTLLKPGSERVLAAFGCYPDPEVLEQEVDHDREVHWQKRKKRWNNKHRGDKTFTWVVEDGVSLGLYRYVVRCRLVRRETGEVVGSGIGSCSSMESKYVDRPRDSENTILKMAKKRAQIDATLSTFGLSDQFTQDVEDNPDIYRQEPDPPPAGTAEPGATNDQLELIGRLKDSHVFTAAERAKLERRLGAGMTKAWAQEAVDWMLATLKERKQAEVQGGRVPPSVSDRVPGEDDDEEAGGLGS
jgi:hypothetical protein